MLRVLLSLIFVLSYTLVVSQTKLPAPISSPNNQMALAMLPDSSLLLSVQDSNEYKIVRYVYKNNTWTREPNQLTDLINGILYEDSHLHYRFSNDYTKFIVMVHGKGDQKIYLSEFENNRWSLFRDIIDLSEYSYFNFTPSFSFDNTKFFLTDNSKPENTINTYTDTYSFDKKEKSVLKEFYQIQDIIGIGKNSVIVNAQRVKGNPTGWYFIKQVKTGVWSVPYKINELDGDIYKFALSLTPFEEIMLFVDFRNGDIYSVPTPEIIRQELSLSKSNEKGSPSLLETVRNPNTDVSTADNIIKPSGKYYALLIGNSDYLDNSLDLDQPHSDILELKSILLDRYSFENEDIVIIENARRETIFKTMYELRSKLTQNDNLLIFYAGHGFWDKEIEQGYWWPIDANRDNPSNWLSNSDLREQIRGLNNAHTLLISDACFSGGIFKTRGGGQEIRKASTDIQLLYRLPSRRAMTSGTMSTVPDNSVFFRFLSKYLKENKSKYLSSSDLFGMIRKSVLNNSLTVPQDGVIMDTGDEGGDFIFILKD